MKYFFVPALFAFACFSACVYEPEQYQEESSGKGDASVVSDIGTVYAIDGGKQICNPSITQDTANYPASMLWLNFSGTLNVVAKDSLYKTKGARDHDRLTITNKDNEVLWYLIVDDSLKECEFQDPEWSTHPDYLVALRGYDLDGKASCDNMDYGIFAVRTSDKKRFWFVDKGLWEWGSPHLWVNPSAQGDTAAADTTVEGFFGTSDVRLVYVDSKNEIVFVDFAKGGLKKKTVLKKSEEMKDWKVDSPMISPDGNFIVFNVLDGGWKSFIQKLSGDSYPVKIERTSDMIGEAMQPHWFTYGERLFVTWTEFPDGIQELVNKNDLSDPSVQDGSAGRTAMREIVLDGDAPMDLSLRWVGSVSQIAPLPMIGGRSKDGKYLATGVNYGFMLELP